MSNKIKEIKKFISGIFSSFSSSDIGDDAASYSMNIDSATKDGVLKGIPSHVRKINTVNAPEFNASTSVIVETTGGKYDLLYFDVDTGQMKIVKDFYGAIALDIPEGASNTGYVPEDIESKNGVAYLGGGKDNPPKIIYSPTIKHFESKKPESDIPKYFYESSECIGPKSSFTADRFVLKPNTYNMKARYQHTGHRVEQGTDADGEIMNTHWSQWYFNQDIGRYGVAIRYDHADLYFLDYGTDDSINMTTYDRTTDWDTYGTWTHSQGKVSQDGHTRFYTDISGDLAGTKPPSITLPSSGKGILNGAACDVCRADLTNLMHQDNIGGQSDLSDVTYYWVLQNIGFNTTGANSGQAYIQKIKLTNTTDVTDGDSDEPTYTVVGSYYVDFHGDNGRENNFGGGPPAAASPGSILETPNHLWIQYWKPSGDAFTGDENFVFNCPLDDITEASGTLTFLNRSMNYDTIKKKTIEFKLSWYWGNKFKEEYFYNSSDEWMDLKANYNWLKGKDEYSNRIGANGGHDYAGFYFLGDTEGFHIYRHGLVECPDWGGDNFNGF